ncbi:MAG: hypothetical protein SGARI_000239, partial [Bacillariaceae sp.]
MPQQQNLFDCGVFVCMGMEAMFQDEEDLSFDQKHVVKKRAQIALEVFTQMTDHSDKLTGGDDDEDEDESSDSSHIDDEGGGSGNSSGINDVEEDQLIEPDGSVTTPAVIDTLPPEMMKLADRMDLFSERDKEKLNGKRVRTTERTVVPVSFQEAFSMMGRASVASFLRMQCRHIHDNSDGLGSGMGYLYEHSGLGWNLCTRASGHPNRCMGLNTLNMLFLYLKEHTNDGMKQFKMDKKTNDG